MEGEMIMVVSIVAIACATGLIKSWMKHRYKNTITQESFDRLAKAFMQHKKEMKRRVENLEAIISDQEDNEHSYAEIEAPKNDEYLTNDLNQKDEVRS